MKTDKPQASLNTLLAAGANVSAPSEAHGLVGLGRGTHVRTESWCDVRSFLFQSCRVSSQFYQTVNLSFLFF